MTQQPDADSANTEQPGADPVMARIGTGIGLRERGHRAAALALFDQLWSEIGPAGDAVHRCALAHSMADVQDDPADELHWDLVALDAADSIDDARLREAGVAVSIRGFYPSLHLNLGEAYRKLGRFEPARHHLGAGRAALDALGDDGYRSMIVEGFDRLAGRIAAAEGIPPPTPERDAPARAHHRAGRERGHYAG